MNAIMWLVFAWDSPPIDFVPLPPLHGRITTRALYAGRITTRPLVVGSLVTVP